jgi:hypothetical protein
MNFGTKYVFELANRKAISAIVMKTIKITLSIALVALTTAAFGQRIPLKQRLFPHQNNEVNYQHADYRLQQNHLDTFMERVRNWTVQLENDYTWAEAPRVTKRYYVDHAEVIYNLVPSIENWMTLPFENETSEEIVQSESWMSIPFDNCLANEVTTIESWMAAPFETDLYEEPLGLESWMASPFVVEEPLEVESWMATSWD